MTAEHESYQNRVLRDLPDPNFYVGPESRISLEFGDQQRVLKLLAGEFPYPPREKIQEVLNEINNSGELLESILSYGSVSDEPFKENVRKIFDIEDNEDVYIVGSGGGQDEILERFITQAVDPVSAVIAPAPFYPHTVDFVSRSWHMPLMPIERPLGEPFVNAVKETIDFRRANPEEGGALIYLNTPSSPTGETVSTDLIVQLIEAADRKDPNNPDDLKINDVVYVDLGLGVDIDQAKALIEQASKHPNVIIGFSIPSKEIGVANLRVGFAVMSKEIGEVYQRARREEDISGVQQILLNKLTDPEIVFSQIGKREKTVLYWKKRLQLALVALNAENPPFPVESLPTDPRVMVMALTGPQMNNSLSSKLSAYNIEAAKGSAWSKSHSEMTDGTVRIVVPMNEEDFNEFIRRLYMIVNNIGSNTDQSHELFMQFMEKLPPSAPPPVFESK